MATTVDCPVCGKRLPWTDASRYRPFCSERCKVIDLGDWAAQRHVIHGSSAETSEETPDTESPSDERKQR